MKKIIFPVLFSLTAIITIGAYTNAQDICSKNIIRLHVIANSDTKEDQNVKLLVRDAILEAFSSCNTTDSKQGAENYIKKHLQLAEDTAKHVLTKHGLTYSVNAEYGHFSFPLRHYGNVILPAGMYDGLRICLGEAKGQNWWCVMYPPLCFNEFNSSTTSNESEKISFEVKFKFLELLKSL